MEWYVAYCESTMYAGGGEYFRVQANSLQQAIVYAEQAAAEYYYEQDYDQLVEDYGYELADEGPYAEVMWCKLASEVEE